MADDFNEQQLAALTPETSRIIVRAEGCLLYVSTVRAGGEVWTRVEAADECCDPMHFRGELYPPHAATRYLHSAA